MFCQIQADYTNIDSLLIITLLVSREETQTKLWKIKTSTVFDGFNWSDVDWII